MIEQLDFGAVRAGDRTTSVKAAAAQRSSPRRAQILAAFTEHGPMTDDALCQALGLPERKWPTIKSARSRLTNDGLLYPYDEGVSTAGHAMTVWALTARQVETVRSDRVA